MTSGRAWLVAIALALASALFTAGTALAQGTTVAEVLRSGQAMNAQAVMIVGGAVTLATQMTKWAGLRDSHGPIAVMFWALVGVAVWAYSTQDFGRSTAFDYFAGYFSVAATSAGIFGFTRASPMAVTATERPPPGAAQNPVDKV